MTNHRVQHIIEAEARQFALSAILAALVLIVGEQVILVLNAPIYFSNIGEWIWNVFISISFLWLLATMYGLMGGLFWQAVVDHVNPIGHLELALEESRQNATLDRRHASRLAATLVAVVCLAAALFVIQIHFSSAYNNKPLAALLFLGVVALLLVAGIWVYSLAFKVVEYVVAALEQILERKVFHLFYKLLIVCSFFLVVALIYLNRHLFEIIDWRPFALLGSYFIVQYVFYRALSTDVGFEINSVVSTSFSLGGWLIILGTMIGIVLAAYPSQPSVAAILRTHSPLTRPIILAIQNLFDQDRDGFSPILLGGDCDDTNILVHPMAQEIPENGIDDDCFAGDAPKIKRERIALAPIIKERISSLQKPYNIFLITIDAFRADHAGWEGYQRQTTPELDAFSKECIIFSNAYSQASNTPQSIPSIISGMYPSQIYWENYENFPKVKNKTELLHETLSRSGYRTAGIFPYWYFSKRNLKRTADWWDTRAFRIRDHSELVATDDIVTDFAIEYMDRTDLYDQPMYMWLHYFDPHFLYVKHDGINFGDRQMDLYDGELRWTSLQVNRFLAYLKETNIYKDSIIVITSDHGEEFKEHGRKYHGSQIYNETIHVPLLIRIPGVKPQTIKTPVSLVDIVPTIHDLVGVRSDKRVNGQSLMPLIFNLENYKHPAVFVEKLKAPTFPWSMQCLIEDNWKLIHKPDEQSFELYNLEIDPTESRNLYSDLPEKAEQMRYSLSEFKLQYLTKDTGWYQLAAKQN